jgi:glycosyltransferase involved in cell wall biosynthesis
MKPVLFVTGHAPAYRLGALARLHEREGIEVALFGGRFKHGGEPFEGEPPFPSRRLRPRELWGLAGSGAYRAVVCPTAGRLAPAACWAGARRAGVPLILWTSLWAHPRTPVHAVSYLALRRLYRSADAVVTYGPHVSAYVRERGARNVHVAPQSVDNDFWRAEVPSEPPRLPWPAGAKARLLFAGRRAREKGLTVLDAAWRQAGLDVAQAAITLAGVGADMAAAPGWTCLDPVAPNELRALYAAAHVLVVPSVRTATFREPWGLVVNEAMNRGLAVIASDAVGAAAGGLVRDGVNGLVVPAGDAHALAAALRRLALDGELRRRLGAQGAEDVRAFDHDAWARGFSAALASVGLGRW